MLNPPMLKTIGVFVLQSMLLSAFTFNIFRIESDTDFEIMKSSSVNLIMDFPGFFAQYLPALTLKKIKCCFLFKCHLLIGKPH
jgi:hypothetical protein